ncbi:MAG: AraC family transcriptional regulator [Candidatus Enteromonas sp.]|nr:AraC family transcriptional regulator [Candidatus Enteromonas sp.]
MNDQTQQYQEYTQETISTSPFTSFLHNHDIEAHKHVFFEFTFCLSGEIINVVNGKRVHTDAFRELLILRPGDTHEIIRETPPSEIAEFHRDIYCMKEKFKTIAEFLKPGLYDEIMNQEGPIVVPCNRENLEALEQMASLLSVNVVYTKEGVETIERHHTVAICNILDLYLRNTDRSMEEAHPEWIQQFFRDLNTERTLRKSIGEIISEMNYSRGHICREFKKHVGKTMVECLNESRIFYSAMLLSNSEDSILDIAMRLNYSSQSAFTNAFKKVYGVSPRTWRASHR